MANIHYVLEKNRISPTRLIKNGAPGFFSADQSRHILNPLGDIGAAIIQYANEKGLRVAVEPKPRGGGFGLDIMGDESTFYGSVSYNIRTEEKNAFVDITITAQDAFTDLDARVKGALDELAVNMGATVHQ